MRWGYRPVTDEQTIGPDERLTSVTAGDPPGDVYRAFNEFAKARFGADSDHLFYDFLGDSLEFREQSGYDGVGSVWTYASTKSATVTFETNLPATSHVEYRVQIDPSFEPTETTERPFSVHVHHLTGLQPGTTYEWRPVAVDERDNERTGEIRTLETKAEGSMTPISVDEDGEPAAKIEDPGEYVLTEDFTARRNAIEIHADDVTLDLGGHTVTYASIEVDPDERFYDDWYAYTENGSFGVWTIGHTNLTVVNGTIEQAETDPQENRGNKESVGFNPVMIRASNDVEVAGLELDYHSPQNTGMRFRAPKDNHHVHRIRQFEMDQAGPNRHESIGYLVLAYIHIQG